MGKDSNNQRWKHTDTTGTEDLIFKCYEHIVACIINNYFSIYLLV